MTLKSLSIENIQSHKNSKLDFVDGVNAIVGTTDSGKSGILRALNWVTNNKPGGNAFRSWWGDDTKVKLTLKNRSSVTRIRTNSLNKYILDATAYEAFGQNVPEEISKEINMSDINWQRQFDPPFLLTESSGEVARRLNKTVDLDIIDVALTNITGRIRQNTQELRSEQSRLEELEEEKVSFKYIEEMEKGVVEVEGLQIKIEGLCEDIGKIQNAVRNLKQYQLRLTQVSGILKAEDKVLEMSELLKKSKVAERNCDDLDETIDNIERYSKQVEQANKILDAKDDLDNVSELLRKSIKIEKELGRFMDLIDRIHKVKKLAMSWEDELEKYENEFNKLMPEVCPLCGRSGK